MAQTTGTEVLDPHDNNHQRALLEHDSPDGNASDKQSPKVTTPRPKRSRLVLLTGLLIAAAGALSWWLYARNYESTDDAQIEGHIDLVSSRINGTVTDINAKVENNQFVEAGTLLLEFDPHDYQAELGHAKANLDTQTAEAHAASVNVPIVNASSFGGLHAAEAAKQEALAAVEAAQAALRAAQHKLQQDEALSAHAERDRVRYLPLVEKDEISRSFYDARATDATAAAQAVEYDRAAIASAQQQVDEARQLVAQREAQLEAARIAPQQVTDARAKSDSAAGHLEQARADLLTAQLNLSYTKVYSPVSGVSGVKLLNLAIASSQDRACLSSFPWTIFGSPPTSKKFSSSGCDRDNRSRFAWTRLAATIGAG